MRRVLTSLLICLAALVHSNGAQCQVNGTDQADAHSVTIEGVVLDTDGAPISGAKITAGLVDERLANAHNVIPAQFLLETDSNGRWSINDDAEWLYSVTIKKEDFRSKMVELPDSGNICTTLQRKQHVLGKVVDSNERPVANAVVSIPSYNELGPSPRETAITDFDGQFDMAVFGVDPPKLVVVGPDGTTGFLSKTVFGPQLNVAELQASVRLRVIVLDESKQPVPNAELTLGSWNSSQAIEWSARTDEHGVAEWNNAPPEKLTFIISKEGYRTKWLKLETVTSDSVAVTLEPPVSIHGNVVDADSGIAIKHFLVDCSFTRDQYTLHPSEERTKLTDILPEEFRLMGIENYSAIGREGRFEFQSREDGTDALVAVVASGYRPTQVRIKKEDQQAEQLIQLSRFNTSGRGNAEDTIVRILNPNGSACLDAFVMPVKEGSKVDLPKSIKEIYQPLHGIYRKICRPNDDGNVVLTQEFMSDLNPRETYVIAWNKNGFAAATLKNVQVTNELTLQPFGCVRLRAPRSREWGRKALVLRVQPHGYQMFPINVNFPISSESNETEYVWRNALVGKAELVDAQGTAMIPANRVLGELNVPQNRELTLNLRGNASVCGKITLSSKSDLPLNKVIVVLTFVDESDSTIRLPVTVQSDGKFRFKNIPAGEYSLSVQPMLFRGINGRQNSQFVLQIVDFVHRIFVNDGETQDLGDIEVSARESDR